MRAVCPLATSHSSTVSLGDAAMRVGLCPLLSALCAACAMRMGAASRNARQPVAPSERLPVEEPRRKIDRRGQAGQAQPAPLSGAIDEIDLERRLHADAILGAYLPQKREGLVIAAEHHVLSVVDALAGLRVGKRGGPPAQHGLRLEYGDARARAARWTAARRPATPAPTTTTSGDVI